MRGYLVLSQLSYCGRSVSPTNSVIEILEDFVISLSITKSQDFIKFMDLLSASLSNSVLRQLAPNDEGTMIFRNFGKYLPSVQLRHQTSCNFNNTYVRTSNCAPSTVLINRYLHMQTIYVKSMRFNCVYFVVPKYWRAASYWCPVDEVRML
jgi:hypothetical protein